MILLGRVCVCDECKDARFIYLKQNYIDGRPIFKETEKFVCLGEYHEQNIQRKRDGDLEKKI